MSTLSLDGGVKPGHSRRLGALRWALPFPRESRIRTSRKVIKRPEFAGVNSPVSTNGEGDMALPAICEILPYKEIELVGPLPRDLAAWIDMSTAVSTRSANQDAALAFIRCWSGSNESTARARSSA